MVGLFQTLNFAYIEFPLLKGSLFLNKSFRKSFGTAEEEEFQQMVSSEELTTQQDPIDIASFPPPKKFQNLDKQQ